MPVKSLSIEEALQWTQQLALREWRLLLPVAFAFLALPQLALGLLLPEAIQNAMLQMTPAAARVLVQSIPWLLPTALAVQFVSMFGMLAIVALALVPRISVREALALAAWRIWVFIAAMLLLMVAAILLLTILSIVLTLLQVGLVAQQPLLFGTLLGVGLVLLVRLSVLAPVIVSLRAGPVASLRLAWELTEGAFWRLAAGLAVYGIGGMVVVFASAFTLGAVLVLVAAASGAPLLGSVLSAVYLRFAFACFLAGLHVLAAAYYRLLGGSIRGM